MHFIDLSDERQQTLVRETLLALLGDHPSPRDHLELCRAANVVIEELEEALVAHALRAWARAKPPLVSTG